VLALTGAQLRVLMVGHARVEAQAVARSMSAIRAAVWADRDTFEAALEALDEGGSEDDRRDWLMGYDEGDDA
jgi:hypothetical protein